MVVTRTAAIVQTDVPYLTGVGRIEQLKVNLLHPSLISDTRMILYSFIREGCQVSHSSR